MRGFGALFALATLAGFGIGLASGLVVWGTILGMVSGLALTLLLNWNANRR
jgi:hypothetical protein